MIFEESWNAYFRKACILLVIMPLVFLFSCKSDSGGGGGGSGSEEEEKDLWVYMDGETPSSLNYDDSKDAENPVADASGDELYVTWQENEQIRVKHWDGSSWNFIDGSSDSGLNDNDNAKSPHLVSANNKLYVSWSEDYEYGSSEWASQIRVKEWDATTDWDWIDGGSSVGLSINENKNANDPQLISLDLVLYAFWREPYTFGYGHCVRAKKWNGTNLWSRIENNNFGLNYSQNKNSHAQSLSQPITYNAKLYISWSESHDTYTNVPYRIRVREWDGTNWNFVDGNTDTGLNYDPSHDAYDPSVTTFNSNLYVAWSEKDDANIGQIRVKEWNGSNWAFMDGSSDTGLNYNGSQSADFPKMTTFNSKLYITWCEYDGSSKYFIRVKEWDGSQWKFVDGNDEDGLTYESAASTAIAHPRLFQYQSDLHIIWEEENSAKSQTKQIRIKKAVLN